MRVAKVALTATIACLGLVATWIALDVAMWTAAKEWRDDCREQLAANLTISAICEEILSRELLAPPSWRSYLKLPDPFSTGYRKIRHERDPELISHDEEGFVQRDEYDAPEPSAGPRNTLASRSPPPYYKRLLKELTGSYGVGYVEEGVRKQSDSEIMYGGMEDYDRQGMVEAFWDGHAQSVNVSRINPIPAPSWWIDDELEIAWATQSEEFEQLDWDVLSYHLNIFSNNRILAVRDGSGSHEVMSLWISDLDDSITGRRCRKSVRNLRFAIGPMVFWDGPDWLLWERAKAWLLGSVILLAIVYADGGHWGRRGTERKESAMGSGRINSK
jgi:hypothetical protein